MRYIYNVQTMTFLTFAGGPVSASVSFNLRPRPNYSRPRLRLRPLKICLETETRSQDLTSLFLSDEVFSVTARRFTCGDIPKRSGCLNAGDEAGGQSQCKLHFRAAKPIRWMVPVDSRNRSCIPANCAEYARNWKIKNKILERSVQHSLHSAGFDLMKIVRHE